MGSIGSARTYFFIFSREPQFSSLSRTGASVKLRESIYTTSLRYLKLLLHPSVLRLSARQVEQEKGICDPPSRGSWMTLDAPRRGVSPLSLLFLSLEPCHRQGPVNVTLSRVPLFYARPNLVLHTSVISVCLPKKRTSIRLPQYMRLEPAT